MFLWTRRMQYGEFSMEQWLKTILSKYGKNLKFLFFQKKIFSKTSSGHGEFNCDKRTKNV